MRTPFLMIIALACGLGAAFLAWRYISNKEGDDPEIEVLVPKADLAPMTRLNKQDMFEKVKVKEKSLRDKGDVVKAFEDLQDPKDKTLNFRARNYPLPAKRPFYKADIVLHKESDLGARLKGDEVAFTLQVSPTDAGGGNINPGDRVDIIAPIFKQGSSEPEYRMVYQNVEVMAVNTSKEPSADGSPQVPNLFILRVDRNMAEQLNAYRSRGALSVSLRKPDHSVEYATKGARPSETAKGTGTGSGDEQPNPNKTPMDPSVPVVTPPTVDTAEIERKVKAEYEAKLEEQNRKMKELLAKLEDLQKPPPEPKEQPVVYKTTVIQGDKRTEYKTVVVKEKSEAPGGSH